MDLHRFTREDVLKAEQAFVEAMSAHLSNFEYYTEGDIEACIEDGYEGFGNGNSIQLFWSDA